MKKYRGTLNNEAFSHYEGYTEAKRKIIRISVFMLAATFVLTLTSSAHAVTAPSAGTFLYDVYDIAVNKILKGAPGFVIGCGAMAWGGSHLFKAAIVPAALSFLAGGVILKSDSITQTLGALVL